MGQNCQKIFICCVFLLISSTLSFSAEIKKARINFKDALEIAFDHNPQMIEARQAIESAKGDLITARTFRNPEAELEFGGFKKRANGERDVNLDSIEIKQPLDPIGVRFLKSKIASNQTKIQSEYLRSAWSSVYLRVRETYFKIVLNKKELELAQDNLKAMRQFFGHVQQRYQSGQAMKNDFQRARIELLQTENAYLSAEKDLKTNLARLNLALGRPLETEFEVEETLQEENLQTSIEELKSIALLNRPDIKIAKLELDSKKKNVWKEQLNRLPSYFLGFKRTNEPDKDDYALFDVYGSYLEAEFSQRQFEISKKSLEEANELMRLANLRYSEGKIDFLNYLEQIKTVKQAKVNYYEGLFHLNRSLSSLEAAIYSSLRQEEFFNEKF